MLRTDHSRPIGRSAGLLPDDVRRILVVAQAEKAGLPEPSIRGPLGEPDLRDELGLRPVRPTGDRPRVGERRLADFERAQLSAELPESLGAVARPDLPRIPKPISLVVADEQGAEVGAAAGGVGVAADHELLPEHAFEL